jgi:ribitol-5-phosphate 2-dehydrogenase (NADP+) / D-ribitol-5-phosphate cytidylyltransferase
MDLDALDQAAVGAEGLLGNAVTGAFDRAGGVPHLDDLGARPGTNGVDREEVVVDDEDTRAGQVVRRAQLVEPGARQAERTTLRTIGNLDHRDGRLAPGQLDTDCLEVAVEARLVRGGQHDTVAQGQAASKREHDSRRCYAQAGDEPLHGGQKKEAAGTDTRIMAGVAIHAIILAAGDGVRFGADMPKQFLRLAGEQILMRSLRGVAAGGVDSLVVVAHPDWLDDTRRVVEAAALEVPTQVVAGGRTRNESTLNGLHALDAADDDVIVIHDAVRPLVPADVIRRSIEPVAAGRAEASDTVIPSADTLVIVEGDEVVEIPDRSRYRRGQTPQVFRRGVLEEAYRRAEAAGDLTATDDASLVLRYVPGARVAAVAGDEVNLKITTRLDFVLADRMLQMRTLDEPPAADPRPAHSLAGKRLLVVGGTQGIGRAIANEAQGQGALAEVDGRSLGLDVRDQAAVEAHVNAAAERLGGLDHVVVTAGVLRIARLAECSAAEIAEVIDTNLTGSLNIARVAYPHLRRSRGSLTLFASSSFTLGRPGYVPYTASKAAIVNAAQGLADEWADDGIRVNVVSPERTDTPMRRRAFPTESRDGMLSPEEVARATLRLIQSELTGQVLDVRRQ